MFENISILVRKSGKGRREMPRHFPTRLITCHNVVLSQMRVCYASMCSALLPKTFINKLPRLASVPLTEVVLQTLSIQSRDFEEIFLTSSRRRALVFSAAFLTLVLHFV